MNLADPALRSGPSAGVLEISVFGPGVSECIVLATPSGRWWVIDSCLEGGEPIAVRYLDALGVRPEWIAGVICTHWHDDHHAGIARVLDHATDARFYCSAALQTREFQTLASSAQPLQDPGSGVDELARVLEILRKRQGGRTALVGPDWLSEGRRFFQEGDVDTTELWSLSPSSAARTLALHSIAQLLPQVGQPKRRLVAERPNHGSVAILVKRGPRAVLLGSDLEEHGDERTGWSAVIANHPTVGGASDVYKVAHHGSPNGHHERLDQLLTRGATAVVTPFRPSRLPSQPDLARLRQLVARVLLTAPSDGRKTAKRSSTVDRILASTVRERRGVQAGMGLVRIRIGAGHAPPDVACFGAAADVTDSPATDLGLGDPARSDAGR